MPPPLETSVPVGTPGRMTLLPAVGEWDFETLHLAAGPHSRRRKGRILISTWATLGEDWNDSSTTLVDRPRLRHERDGGLSRARPVGGPVTPWAAARADPSRGRRPATHEVRGAEIGDWLGA
jgi:hypothetical protein